MPSIYPTLYSRPSGSYLHMQLLMLCERPHVASNPYKSQCPPPHHFHTAMDWFTWLSRTNLDPSLTYEYGVTFARNELEPRDAAFFDHEFLQSMGVSIAKHRLEILKLAKKDYAAPNKKLSGVIKRCLRKCVSKLVILRDEALKEMPPEPNWFSERRRGSLKEEKLKPMPMANRTRSIALSGPLDGRVHEKVITSNKVLKLSGPLDGKMGPLDGRMVYTNRSPMIPRPVDHGKLMGPVKSPRLSGPLDSRVMPDSRSPRLTRASEVGADSPMGFSPYYNRKVKSDYEYDDENAQWPALFQDLKPT